MTFEEFLQGLSDDNERDAVRARWTQCAETLKKTGTQRQFAINFTGESRLSKAAWKEVEQAIMKRNPDAPRLQQALTEAFRAHTLTGDPISPTPAPLGRAVTRGRFEELMRHHHVFDTDDEKDQFMADLLDTGATTAFTRDQLRGRLLANYVMWATLNYENPGGDPFAKMPDEAHAIRARLGLDPNDSGDMLLFVYTLPGGTPARFPTICDAYAGDAWLRYFRPALPSDTCGWTMTWDAGEEPPCPEVVHEPVTGDTLTEPLRIAKQQ